MNSAAFISQKSLISGILRPAMIFAILTLFIAPVPAQTIESVFKKLPLDCTPELPLEQREILLKNQNYILPGGDSVETVMYSLGLSEADDYLNYEYSFTTGQNGFVFFEIKKFKKDDGSSLVLFSRYGGLLRSFSAQELRIFDLKNNMLTENTKQALLPKTIDVKEFLKRETPDSLIKRIEQALNTSYSLNADSTNEIEFRISPGYPLNENEKWILDYEIKFRWNGKNFEKHALNEKVFTQKDKFKDKIRSIDSLVQKSNSIRNIK